MVVPVYFQIVDADWGKERMKLEWLLWESQPPIGAPLSCLWFPGGSDGKESACNAGDLGLIPESGRSPGGWLGSPLQYSGPENSMERSLAGYSPWHRKQGTAEQLSTHAWSLVAADPVCLMIRSDYERPNFWLAELDNMHFLVDCWDTFITWCFMSGFSLWQGFRKQDRSRFLTKIIIIFWFHSFADSQCQNTNG